MSDTPETDVFMTRIRGIDGDKHWVPADTAKRLERERDKWEETARLYCQNSDFHREMREKAERERDEARELLASEKITRDHIIKRGIEMQKERDEARAHWGTESMNAAQFFGEKTKAIAERDEAIKLLKYSSTYSTTKAQEDTYKFLRKINKWKDTK